MKAMTQTNKEYASALFSLAIQTDAVDEYEKSLQQLKMVFEENQDYIKLLESPAIPMSERAALIDEAFGNTCSEYLLSFIKVLCENGHIKEICSCIEEFFNLVRVYKNRTIATIYYVEPLTQEQKTALLDKLQKISGKIIEPQFIKDESLIGGIKVQIDDKTFDGSIKNRLHKAKGEMNK